MNLPNRLTVARILLAPVFLILLMVDFPCHYLAAGLVFGAAALTDLFDGKIARGRGLVTNPALARELAGGPPLQLEDITGFHRRLWAAYARLIIPKNSPFFWIFL